MAARPDQEGFAADRDAATSESDEAAATAERLPRPGGEDEGPCPDLEELAAYLDGTLESGRRQVVIRHLARCGSCFEVFAMASDMLHDEPGLTAAEQQAPAVTEGMPGTAAKPWRPFEPSSRPARTSRGPRWWRRGLAAATAAAAVLAGVEVVNRQLDPLQALTPGRLAAALGRPGGAAGLWPEPASRGRPEEARAIDEVEFRLGLNLVDLRTALVRRAKGDASETLRRLYVGVNEMLIPPPGLAERIQALRNRVEAGEPLSPMLSAVDALERDTLSGTVPPAPQLGAWSEVCRLDAVAALDGPLRRRAVHRLLAQALDPKDGLDPQDTAARQLMKQLDSRVDLEVTPASARALSTLCDALIQHYDPKESS
jgi:anti-sigma factor RsiW